MTVVTQNPTLESVLPQVQQGQEIARVDGQKELGKDAFLKLLVAQMKYQDPLNPMENLEITQQLAQFTSLEQLYNLNSQLTNVNSTLQSQNNYQAMDLVGKEIKAQGSTLSVSSGSATGGSFTLEEAATVNVLISNEAGEAVRTLSLGQLAAGDHNIVWDAKYYTGATAADGNYTFSVAATNASGEQLTVDTRIQGRVTGVAFNTSESPTLVLNKLQVGLADVLEAWVPAASDDED
ncbi:MAG: flagellar hook capping FlgD N-terminal domain-containing protein [Thermodesulfobacteriota bacterium]